MIERDPLAREIRKRLAEKPNPEKFERCACDLLREQYPRLVLVSGGSDGGMDGAIPSSGGPPIPLVCTTAEDVIGNLTKNLESYEKEYGGKAQEVVVATSQHLTARKRRNLEERACKLRFASCHIYDYENFVLRLYSSPRWCLELLGLTQDPPALSRFPLQRQQLDPEIMGQEKVDWLRETGGDFLLLGQPGVGKASLLKVLADEKRGLFVVSEDLARIASDYRAERPEYVLVEDAQLRLSLVRKLCRLRLELGARFKIGATAWPSPKSEVKRIVEESQSTGKESQMAVYHLDGLPRETVAAMVRSVVPAECSDEVVAEILNRSAHEDNRMPPPPHMPIDRPCKPGLALTLAEQVIRKGGITQLSVDEHLLAFLKDKCGLEIEALDALAVFALGGRAGVTLEDAAKALGHSGVDVRKLIHPVCGTGILEECGRRADSSSYRRDPQPSRVEPAALREALVQRTFFSGGMSIGVERALEFVEDRDEATSTLIRACARGAHVSHELIRDRLRADARTTRHRELWQEYAWTGRDAVCWIAEEHPQFVESIARPALAFASEEALPKILESASDGIRPSRGGLMAIKAWIGRVDTGIIGRRSQVLDELIRLSREESIDQKTLALMHDVFSLTPTSSDWDPVSIGKFYIHLGTLPAGYIEELARLWPRAVPILRKAGDVGVGVAQGIARSWAREAHQLREKAVERSDIVGGQAVTMVSDVVELAGRSPGIRLWAARLAERTNLPSEFSTSDPVLDALFPAFSGDGESGRREQAAASLAEDLTRGDIEEGAKTLVHYAREGTRMEANSTELLAVVKRIAELAPNPAVWVEALVHRQAPAEWLDPFVRSMRAADHDMTQTWQLFRERLCATDLVRLGVYYADPPADSGRPSAVVRHVLEHAADACLLLRESICWPDVGDGWKVLLMTHEDPAVRSAVAEGVFRWYERRGDPALSDLSASALLAWSEAFLGCVDYMVLGRVFRQFPDVAQAWLLDREDAAFAADEAAAPLDHETFDPHSFAKEIVRRIEMPSFDKFVFDEAVSVLAPDQRKELIRALPETADPLAVTALVGTSIDLYRTLLSRRQLRRLHLRPLEAMPISSELADFVLAALDQANTEVDHAAAGQRYTEADLLVHIRPSSPYDDARNAMEKWKEHEDDRIRRIARKWLSRFVRPDQV